MQNKLMNLYDKMFSAYGPRHWWPGDTPWEICVGAVLTQNTNWRNVERAIANLKNINALSPEKIMAMPHEELAEAIRPSGYYNLKAKRLRAVTSWWLENVVNNKLSPDEKPLEYWRDSLLEVKGAGPETVDSILLYAFNLPTFVIDAYTKRIMARHFGTGKDIPYDQLRNLFMDNLPHDARLFNEFHALFVETAKNACLKKSCLPECPLR